MSMKQVTSSAARKIPDAFRGCKFSLAGVALFSAVINILTLTGSIYMLQVYDRVIPSRSMETLLGLTILLVGLYFVFGLLDVIRGRILARIGLQIDANLRQAAFAASARLPIDLGRQSTMIKPVRDLDAVRSFFSGLGPTALFDFPWIPFYLALIFYLHPWLGLLASAGALVLIGFAILTELSARRGEKNAGSAIQRQNFIEEVQKNAEVIRSMGMESRLAEKWFRLSHDFHSGNLKLSDLAGGLGSMAKIFRMLLQSFVLGLGAYLVTIDQASAGVMIAASIMTSRALAPVEIAISHWKSFIMARSGLKRLNKIAALQADPPRETSLPAPHKSLILHNVSVAAPGSRLPILRNISLKARAGDGIGIIGESGAGKSTLARALVGAWPAIAPGGSVRLDDADLSQWSPQRRGEFIGYVPQKTELFAGTIARNICRFQPDAPSKAIIEAAKKAGVHEFILGLDQGYDTYVGGSGEVLSGGQQQRIALARALYGDPFLVVLDEPNSNLDRQGDLALGAAIMSVRERGGIIIVISHRPSALDHLNLVLELQKGKVKFFGRQKPTATPQPSRDSRPAAGPAISRHQDARHPRTSNRIAIVGQHVSSLKKPSSKR